jgi:hypothetical protein
LIFLKSINNHDQLPKQWELASRRRGQSRASSNSSLRFLQLRLRYRMRTLDSNIGRGGSTIQGSELDMMRRLEELCVRFSVLSGIPRVFVCCACVPGDTDQNKVERDSDDLHGLDQRTLVTIRPETPYLTIDAAIILTALFNMTAIKIAIEQPVYRSADSTMIRIINRRWA